MTAIHEEDDILSDEPWNEEVVEMPIDGVLDLHTFSPKEVKDLIDDYLAACLERKIYDVRIIHGKGKGILRDHVRALLARHPSVESFQEAPLEAGGWGATVVRLRSKRTKELVKELVPINECSTIRFGNKR